MWFVSLAAARAKLWRLEKQKKIRKVGTVSFRSTGRPLDMYCTRKIAKGTLLHDLIVSKLVQPLFQRGVPLNREDGTYRSDCVIGEELYLELDRGTESLDQVLKHISGYLPCEGYILFVAPTEHRKNRVLRGVRGLEDKFLATTLKEAQHDILGEIWEDSLGNRTSIVHAL